MGNLKLGVKLVGGFLLCAAITLVVGLVGLMGISGLTKSLTQVTEVDLPAVRDLQAIKIAGESVRVAQRTLNVPGLSEKDRKRQYENIANLRESYRKSWEEYEKLPKSPEAEKLWREFVPAWQEWVKVNNETFDLAREWDKSDIDDPDALENKLAQFRGDHYKLLTDAESLVLFGTPLSGGDDSTKCNFGRWLDAEGRDIANPVFRKTLTEVRAIHDKLHQSVGRLKELAARNAPREEQAAIVRADLLPAVAATMGHFATLSQEVARVSAICAKMRVASMETVRSKQVRCFELLDS
ncbi:MCP four helix bundle domain-containing protein, partial [Solidesulfovibrio sp.]|uniref:MCP four helix bundle domain-containing protein n=1 Tax=Solidesulfovibrio sp. TaxID=2910990 RepID=UPI002613DBF6